MKRGSDEAVADSVRDFFIGGVAEFIRLIVESDRSIDESLSDAFTEFKTNVLQNDEWQQDKSLEQNKEYVALVSLNEAYQRKILCQCCLKLKLPDYRISHTKHNGD